MKTDLDDYIDPWPGASCSQNINLWQACYLNLACDDLYDCTIGTTCLADAMDWTNTNCKPYLDAMWLMYRGAYLDKKAVYVAQVQNLTCSRTAAMTNKEPAFRSIQETRDLVTATDEQGIRDEGNTKLKDYCKTQCEDYADYWMKKLNRTACNSSVQDSIDLRNEFIAICRNGCNGDNPQGATSVSDPNGVQDPTHTYMSFQEAFDAYAAQSKLTKQIGVCDINLISIQESTAIKMTHGKMILLPVRC